MKNLASAGEMRTCLLLGREGGIAKVATFRLIVQAIAEDAGISVTDDDVTAYFSEYTGTDDYSAHEETCGMPYLKLVVLNQKVMDYLEDNANVREVFHP